MDAVLRSTAVYLFTLIVFRLAGRRTLAQMTAFDFVLLIIIGNATQQALLGNDFSVTNGFLVILTLVGVDIGLSLLKRHVKPLERVIDGLPVILVKDGQPIEDRMNATRVDERDILEAARQTQGLERMDQIKYAVLERAGGISIVPKQSKSG